MCWLQVYLGKVFLVSLVYYWLWWVCMSELMGMSTKMGMTGRKMVMFWSWFGVQEIEQSSAFLVHFMVFLKGSVRRAVVGIQARQASGVKRSRGWAGGVVCQLWDVGCREAKCPCRSIVGFYVGVHCD